MANEITGVGKFIAGFLLIALTSATVVAIVALWPDKIPSAYDRIEPVYRLVGFRVGLAMIPDTTGINRRNAADTVGQVASATQPATDTPTRAVPPDGQQHRAAASPPGAKSSPQPGTGNRKDEGVRLIHINTLILVLVALGGFLGNLIYVAASFTDFVGAEKFRRSWLLWYCVKPFTASALALAIYFVFRGGFLNASNDAISINLFGTMTISVLAGLFTDRTTLKMKEVFDVLLRPNEQRPDALQSNVRELNVEAPLLEVGVPATIMITGQSLPKEKLTASIEGQEVPITSQTEQEAKIQYTLPVEYKNKAAVMLRVTNEKGQPILSESLPVTQSSAAAASPPTANGTDNDTERLTVDSIVGESNGVDENAPKAKG
jgi:hypothetical protein